MGMKKEPIITKKAGKFQPNLLQNLIYCQVTLYGVYLKVISLYQIIVFYANPFYPGTFFCWGYYYTLVSLKCETNKLMTSLSMIPAESSVGCFCISYSKKSN